MRKEERMSMQDERWIAHEGDHVKAAPGMVLTEKGADILNLRRNHIITGKGEVLDGDTRTRRMKVGRELQPLRTKMPELGFGSKYSEITGSDLEAVNTTPF